MGLRGQASLFEELFVPAELTVHKGRSERLINQRDERLVHRYYYYGEFTDKRFEAILDQLRTEFDIETYTIQERLSENYALLKQIKATKPDLKFFKEKWPFMMW